MNTKFTVGKVRYSLIVSPRGRDELPDIGTSIEYHPWTTTSDRQKAKLLSGLNEFKDSRRKEAGRQPRLPVAKVRKRRRRECVSV